MESITTRIRRKDYPESAARQPQEHAPTPERPFDTLLALQRTIGNRGFDRLLSDGGYPLDETTRALMEERLGHDFSRVRVHTDSSAALKSRDLGMRAFTVGQDVVFGADEYRPGTPQGDRLIAHELAHTLQQDMGQARLPQTSEGDIAFEQEAERAADAAIGAKANQFERFTPQNHTGLQVQGKPGDKDPPGTALVNSFASKFKDAADLIRKSPAAMKLAGEAEAGGAKFGGYAEEGPAKNTWAYTVGNTVYIPKARTDPVLAMSDFLFELNNAIRAPKFRDLAAEAAKGSKGTLTAKDYAYKQVEQEVEGMLRLGEAWAEMKKTASGKGTAWDKYDADFYLAEYNDFKAKKKTKDDIVKNVLQRVYPAGANKGKTVEQFYIDQYNSLSGGK